MRAGGGIAEQTAPEAACDDACMQVKTQYSQMAELSWGGEGEESNRRYIFEQAESLLEALGQNTQELRDNADAMREKENSAENKLLDAMAIGAVGWGTMELASGMAEQAADESAEQDMRAYLATFTCDYGQGRNIKGGQTNIEVPGSTDLIVYYNEYMELASKLKSDKEALGMAPGIEADVIIDKSESGLYDNVSLGRQRGAFTSLSRALMDENSIDAIEWQTQKDGTKKKIETGATVAAAGVVASVVANIAMESHAPKERSAEILAQRKKIENDLKLLISTEIVRCNDFIVHMQEMVTQDKDNNPELMSDPDASKTIDQILSLELLDPDGDLSQLKDHPICM